MWNASMACATLGANGNTVLAPPLPRLLTLVFDL